MAFPHYEAFYFPLLKVAAQLKVSRREAARLVASDLGLTEEDMRELTPGGSKTEPKVRYIHATEWAATHLFKAGLIIYPERGHLAATDFGRKFLREHPGGFSKRHLVPLWKGWGSASPKPGGESPPLGTPEEHIRSGVAELRHSITPGLLARIARKPPDFLGSLAIDLLLKAEHGSNTQGEAPPFDRPGRHTRECVVDLQGAFGRERIQLRADRSSVSSRLGERDIRDFVDSVQVNKASRGVFVTTSEFTPKAHTSAERASSRIDLVGGEKLAALMMDLSVGCRERRRYSVPEVDEDYFGT